MRMRKIKKNWILLLLKRLVSSFKKFLFRQVSSSLLSLSFSYFFFLLFLSSFFPYLLSYLGKERKDLTLSGKWEEIGEKLMEKKEGKEKKVGETNLQILIQGKTQFKIHSIQFS